jgi:hypothetical protein
MNVNECDMFAVDGSKTFTPQLAARKQDDLGYRSAARGQLVACFSAPAISRGRMVTSCGGALQKKKQSMSPKLGNVLWL